MYTQPWISWLLSLIFLTVSLYAKDDFEFFIIVLSFNNNKIDEFGKNWIERCLESIFIQTYKNWMLCYVNDCSSDDTGTVAERYARQRGMVHKCQFLQNSSNEGGLANMYKVITACSPTKVIVQVDGDDELFDQHVLRIVANEYRYHHAWMTYGSYITSPWGYRGIGAPIPKKIMRNRRFRQFNFVTSHLKTFIAKLFQSIKKKDLMYQGKFFRGGSDLAMLFPMLEMASNGHVRYINRIVYKWNCQNPLSDFRVHSDEQGFVNSLIRTRPPYPALKHLFKSKAAKK